MEDELDRLLQAARYVDAEIGGKELAQMPSQCAKAIVALKRSIQDLDAAMKKSRWSG